MPSRLGAEPKKLAVLGGLLVALVVVFVVNSGPDVPEQAAPANAPAAAPAPVKAIPARTTPAPTGALPPQRSGAGRRENAGIQDFKPSLKLPDGVDVSRIDPSLKLDLLARLQDLKSEGGERSLFEFGPPPKPKTPEVEPVKPQNPTADPAKPAATDATAAATPTAPPKPPPPPAIPLKFYGYVGAAQGPSRRAFFLDGEDIVVAGENDVIRNRYKVIRIGVNSAVIEDTTNKNQQTLPLIEELAG
jgi:hypothetical protein